jgi:hypothetical protein
MLAIGDLRVGVKLLPLLVGDVEIDDIQFTDTDVLLNTDANSQTNWHFTTTKICIIREVNLAVPYQYKSCLTRNLFLCDFEHCFQANNTLVNFYRAITQLFSLYVKALDFIG